MRSILVVEDEEPLLRAMTLILSKAFTTHTARNADEARQALLGKSIDVVVTDYSMPNEDGVTLARSLREQGFKGPLVLVTAMPDITDIRAALTSGVISRIVTKPWTVARLLAEITAAADG